MTAEPVLGDIALGLRNLLGSASAETEPAGPPGGAAGPRQCAAGPPPAFPGRGRPAPGGFSGAPARAGPSLSRGAGSARRRRRGPERRARPRPAPRLPRLLRPPAAARSVRLVLSFWGFNRKHPLTHIQVFKYLRFTEPASDFVMKKKRIRRSLPLP